MPTLEEAFGQIVPEPVIAPYRPPYERLTLLEKLGLAAQARQRREQELASQQATPPGEAVDVVEAQRQSLQSHALWREASNRALSQVQERQSDLALAEELLDVFDTNVPRAARQLIFTQFARKVGVDPRSEAAREFGAMVMALDPDASQAVRAGLTNRIRTAPPGSVGQFASAVLRGQIGARELMRLTVASQPTPMTAAIAPDPEGDDTFWMRTAQAGQGPAMAGAADAQAAPVVDFSTPYQESRRQPRDRIAHPDLAERYGLDPSRPWTNQDLVDRGYRGPLSLQEQQALIAKEDPRERARLGLAYDFEIIRRAIEDPRVLPEGGGNTGGFSVGYNGFNVRAGGGPGQTTAEGMTRQDEKFNALRRWLGLPERGADPTDRALTARENFLVRSAGARFATHAEREGMTPEQIDQMRGIVEQRFASAIKNLMIVRGESNASQSDADAARLTAGLNSPTRATRIAVMADVLDSVFAQQSELPLNVAQYRPDVRQMIGQSPIAPQVLRDAVARIDPNAGPALDARHFTGRERFVAPETGGAQNAPTDTRSPAAQQPNRAERLQAEEQRLFEQSRSIILERLDLERRSFELREQEARENRAYRQRQEARQARLDAERRQEQIRDLFAQIGRLLAAGPRGGTSIGPTPMPADQDARAFQIAPPPARRPPTPVQAVSGFARPGRRRSNSDE